MAPPGAFIKEILLVTEFLSTGAVKIIFITGLKFTWKKLLLRFGELSFNLIEETWKLPGAGGGVGSVLFEQLIKQTRKKGRRSVFIGNKLRKKVSVTCNRPLNSISAPLANSHPPFAKP
jgi:hypothetical protein